MRVGIATSDWAHVYKFGKLLSIMRGCGWVRLGQYSVTSRHKPVLGTPIWSEKHGIFGIKDSDDNEFYNFDVVILQRIVHRSMPERIRSANKAGQFIAQDVDDWYWGGGTMTKNANWIKNQPQSNPDCNVNTYRDTLAAANAVILSTPYLADRIHWVANNRKHLMENHVDFSQYPKWEHTEQERPTIGWAGFTPLRVGDLDILKKFYSNIKEEFRFHHSGHMDGIPAFADEVGLPRDLVTTSPAENFIGDYRLNAFRYDIGVVPLVDTQFNLAKSWLKGVEYTAAGIPFVASPVGEYLRLRKLYGAGRFAEKIPDWKKQLRALKSPAVRQEEAAENLERLKVLDLPGGVKKWDDMIDGFTF